VSDPVLATSDEQLPAIRLTGPLLLLSLAAVLSLWLLFTPAGRQPELRASGFVLDQTLATAKVSIRRNGAETPCTWRAADKRWQCAPDSYAFVGPYAGIAAGKSLTGLWIHPLPGATTVLRTKVPARGLLTAPLGLVDDAPPGTPLQVQLFLADKPIGTLRVTDGLQTDTEALQMAVGKQAELRVEVSAPDHAWRLGVLDLSIAPVAGGEP
jgi:hypothetical protein